MQHTPTHTLAGQEWTDGNGFRLDLRNRVHRGGNTNVSYIETIHHGNVTDNACEAYPGRTSVQMKRLALQPGAYIFASKFILVHLGTNDRRVSSHETSSTALSHFASLPASLKQDAGDSLVIVSNLIEHRKTAVDQCITPPKAGLLWAVQQAREDDQKGVLVDMHGEVLIYDLNATDSTHPSDVGYAVMARKWYQDLKDDSTNMSRPNGSGSATSEGSAAERTRAGPSNVWLLR